MAFELVYLSQAGNRSFWTLSHHFSKKADDHCSWDSRDDLVNDFSRLRDDYPTIFATKNDERFYVAKQGTEQLEQLTMIATSTDNLPLKEVEPSPSWVSNKMTRKIKKDKKYYAVATRQQDTYRFLDTTLYKNGGFVYPLNADVRRWKEDDKAIATARTLTANQNFWSKYPDFDNQYLTVLDLRNGKVIWSTDDLQLDQLAVLASALSVRLDRLSQRVTDHLDDENRGSLTATAQTEEQPAFDLATYNAKDFFASLKYVLECLIHRDELNRLLGWYDGKILQDQLHLVELVDFSSIDAAKFVQYLQKTRRIRREVKDLAVLVNTVADNMDAENIIKKLNGNQSLANQYQYRDKQAAEVLQDLTVKTDESTNEA